MAYFTSYDAIEFIDLARNPKINAGRKSSVQGFLNTVLELDNKIDSDMVIKSHDILSRGGSIVEALRSSQIKNVEDRILALRNNLISEKKVGHLDEKLKERIKHADNFSDHDKERFDKMTDFSERIYHLLIHTLYNQKNDLEILSKNHVSVDEQRPFFITLRSEITDEDTSVLDSTLDYLKNVSDYLFDQLFIERSRYYEYNIEPELLTLGFDDSIETYGTSDDKDIVKMSEFLNSKDDLFISGQGGVGKSTLLINEYKSVRDKANSIYLPIYMALTKVAEKHYEEDYIISELLTLIESVNFSGLKRAEFDCHKQKVYLEELLDNIHTPKKVLLLLDGFNEISNLSSSEKKNSIRDEIERLSTKKNVRIILTSRPFDGFNDAFLSFKHITATGISKESIKAYLEKIKVTMPTDLMLLDILRIPLFLKMYGINHLNHAKEAATRGAILYEYFNGESSIYNELKKIKGTKQYKDDNVFKATPLILDFIMPAIAAYMEMHDTFSISSKELNDILTKVVSLVAPFDELNDEYFGRYDAQGMLSILADELKNHKLGVLGLLTDHFSFVERDSQNNISFVHQYFKDYFTSFFRILTYRQRFINHDDMYWEYAHSLMDGSPFELTLELAYHSDLCNLSIMRAVFESCPDKKDKMFINNLLMMISMCNYGSLAGFDFDSFDLSDISLTDYIFSNKNGHANFINCELSDVSFFSYEFADKVLRCLSFYNGRPAVFEVIVVDDSTYFKIIDLRLNNVLVNEEWSAFNYNSSRIFEHLNEIMITDDGNFVVIYDSSPFCHDFVVYDRLQKKYAMPFFPENCTNKVLRFDGNDRLIMFADGISITVYDLSYKNPPVVYKRLEEIIADISSTTPGSNDNGIIAHYDIPDDGFFITEDDQSKFDYNTIYPYKDKFILVYDAYDLDETVRVYSTETNNVITLDMRSEKENLRRGIPSCIYENYLYLLFYDELYEIDLDTYDYKLITEIDDYVYYLYIERRQNKLYLFGAGKLQSVDLNAKYIARWQAPPVNRVYDHAISNENYLVIYDSDTPSLAEVFRLDIESMSRYKFGGRNYIEDVIYLSEDKTLLFYNSGYVALLDPGFMYLIDSNSLPNDDQLRAVSYNATKHQLAVSVGYFVAGRIVSKVYIADTSIANEEMFKPIKIINDEDLRYSLCYSSNGKYLFADTDKAIYVYDTDTYERIYEIPVEDKVEYIQTYGDFICVFISIIGAGLEGYTLTIIDTKDIHAEPVIIDVNEVDYFNDDYNNVFLTEIGYKLYKKINTSDKPEDLMSSFIYRRLDINSFEYLSDYYEDGLFIKCSTRDLKGVPENNVVLSSMTTDHAHIDKKHEFFYGISKDQSFLKFSLDSRTAFVSNIIPELRIKDCVFETDKPYSDYINMLIDTNAGKFHIRNKKYWT